MSDSNELRAEDFADAPATATGHDGQAVTLTGAVFTPWSLAALENEIMSWRNLHPDQADDDDERWQ